MKIFSAADSLPAGYVFMRVNDYENILQADSIGLLTIPTREKKIRLINEITGYHRYDTILSVQNRKDTITIFVPFKPLLAVTDWFICLGGYDPVPRNDNDREFEKTYHITYYITGCVVYYSFETIMAHNWAIARHLDKLHGPSWRQKVRKDVPGISH